MRHRIKNILIAIDQFLLTVVTLGGAQPDDTISAAAYRLEMNGSWAGRILRPMIDWIASPFEENHCRESFLSELNRKHLPNDYHIKT